MLKTLLTIFYFVAKTWSAKYPNPLFIHDFVTKFKRNAIIYHVPDSLSAKIEAFDYFKEVLNV